MAFGYYGRTPEDVQYANRQYYDFKKIKERYTQTPPIKGKRAKLNIRPHGERDRSWERIIEVNENEYYLTNDAYAWFETPQGIESGRTHSRLMSFKQVGDTEYFTLHTPRTAWNKTHPDKLYPYGLSPSSTFNFIKYNMPYDLHFYNIKSRKYVRCNDRFYSAEKGDITFTRKGSNDLWMPLVVHREVTHHLDKAKTKEIREKAKDFLEYANVMCGLVEKKWVWGNQFQDENYSWEDKLKMNDDGSLPDDWLRMVEAFKHKATDYYSGFSEKRMVKHIMSDLFDLAKPVAEVEVPLGTPCYDKYRKWFI